MVSWGSSCDADIYVLTDENNSALLKIEPIDSAPQARLDLPQLAPQPQQAHRSSTQW
jgi:hypothetical protein